ncbi:MAG: TRAP transporter small permease [Succinatimonas sp.]|nr:TRAP transporter small permease [Succinatimonas sp.]
MGSLRDIFTKIQSVARAIIALCMIIMMTVIFVQTATRYVVFYSIPWSEEVSRYLYVTLTLLGLNLAMSSKQLVRIDIIDHKISRHALKYLNILREALTVVITVVFFYSSFGMIDVSQYQSSPALGMSMQIMYTILGVGFFLSACAAVFNFCDAVKAFSSNEE